MPAHLAQVCLFAHQGSALRTFCQVVSGQVEIDNGSLLSYHMGASTVAHHPPVDDLGDGEVLVTLQVASPQEVDRIHQALTQSGQSVDDAPEDTDWGWRIFWYRAAPHLVFEVGAPLP